MIIPEKHLDLNHCVLRAGAVLLRHLKKARVASVAKLRNKLLGINGRSFTQDEVTRLIEIRKNFLQSIL